MFYFKKQPEFYIKFDYLKQRCGTSGNIGKTDWSAYSPFVRLRMRCQHWRTVGISPDC